MVIKQIELLRWKYVYPGWLYLHNKEKLFSLHPTYKPIYNIFAKNKLNYIHGASGKFAVPNTARAFHKNEFKEGLMVNTSEWRMCFCKHISTICVVNLLKCATQLAPSLRHPGQTRGYQEIRIICRHESAKFEKGSKSLHAFITVCLFRMFELSCINVFEL